MSYMRALRWATEIKHRLLLSYQMQYDIFYWFKLFLQTEAFIFQYPREKLYFQSAVPSLMRIHVNTRADGRLHLRATVHPLPVSVSYGLRCVPPLRVII